MAAVAQKYAEQCKYEHNSERVSQQSTFASVGENVAFTSPVKIIDTLYAWSGGKNNYDFDANSCAAGAICDSYLQVGL